MAKQILSITQIFSEFQMREDEIIYQYFKLKDEHESLIKEVNILSRAQDYCSFNVFWAIGISPVFLRIETFDFIIKNKHELRRKLTLKEVFALDFNIRDLNPENFQNLKQKLNQIKKLNYAL